MRVVENRASLVLYNFLKSNRFIKPFLIPSNVCPIVPSTFIKANVRFEFIDVNDKYIIDECVAIDKLKSSKYDGVFFVHAYGKEFNVNSFFFQIKNIDTSLVIIDDRCLTIPDTTKIVTDLQDLILFSTGFAKYAELGYGGWGIINDSFNYIKSELVFNKNHYDKLMTAHSIGVKNNTPIIIKGMDWLDPPFNIDEDVYFDRIDALIYDTRLHKEIINRIYFDNLPKEVLIDKEFVNWRFIIKTSKRDNILKDIFAKGLFAGTNYPSISHLFSNTKSLIAERQSKYILNLFNDFRYDESKAIETCKIINKYY